MAIEDDKHPKRPFNEAAQEPGLEVVFESNFDDELSDGLDQQYRGNTDPKHDPKNQRNSPLTPSGTGPSFSRGSGSEKNHSETPNQPESSSEKISDEEWQKQLRTGNHTLEQEFNGFRVRAWRTDQPSDKGIHEGHLNKMIVTQGKYGQEQRVAEFDAGEWTRPAASTPERQAILEFVEAFDGEYLSAKREQEQMDREQQQQIDKGKDTGKTR